MALFAFAAFLLFLAAAFGLRTLIHYRRTGTTGFAGVSGRVGSAEWLGGVLFVVALLAGGAAPLAQHFGWLGPWPALDGPGWQAAGVLVFSLGFAATLWAQFAMGKSWRIGVDEAARTALVASGPFAWVRNPIFTAMLAATLGLLLLVPNWISALALLALLLGLELQVRCVEEPYLLRTHGETYRRYAARTGRFVPGLGRGTSRVTSHES